MDAIGQLLCRARIKLCFAFYDICTAVCNCRSIDLHREVAVARSPDLTNMPGMRLTHTSKHAPFQIAIAQQHKS